MVSTSTRTPPERQITLVFRSPLLWIPILGVISIGPLWRSRLSGVRIDTNTTLRHLVLEGRSVINLPLLVKIWIWVWNSRLTCRSTLQKDQSPSAFTRSCNRILRVILT